jgi:putative DNA primase/helicase
MFLFGPGGTGKSTFVGIIQDLFGSYAKEAEMSTFTQGKYEAHPTQLAWLRGARLVTAQETEHGRKWNEALLKKVTGGDRIAARYMRKDFFEFTPEFTLMVSGNHTPHLSNADEALARRFQIVPFNHKPTAVNRKLRQQLKIEYPGIMRWILNGYELLQAKRAKGEPIKPQIVVETTNEYFDDEDPIARYIHTRVVKTETAESFVALKTLYEDYDDWAVSQGILTLTDREFSQRFWKLTAAQKRKTNAGIVFHGYVLNPLN